MADLNPNFLDNSGVSVVFAPESSDFTQYPSFLTNGNSVFSPDSSDFTQYPAFLTNGNSVFSPDSSDFTQYPAFLTNVSNVFSPDIDVTIHPNFLVNSSLVFSPDVVSVLKPNFLVNISTVYFAKIEPAQIQVDPDFLVNSSDVFSLDPDILLNIPFFVNNSVVFEVVPVYDRTFFIPFIQSSSKINKPIIKEQPIPEFPVEPDEIVRSVGNLPVGERSTTDVNRIFKDFGVMFRPHPLTGDLTRVFDYDAVTQSIRSIISTSVFERPYSSQEVAGNIREKLFELGGAFTVDEIREDLSLAIIKYEPRVIVERIDLKEIPEKNSVELTVQYKVKTFKTNETLTLILERA